MKHTIAICVLTLLSGCSLIPDDKTPVKSSYDSQGRIVQQTTELTGDQYVTTQVSAHKSNCQQQYYSIPTSADGNGDNGQLVKALITALQSLNPRDPCPTVAAPTDVDIAQAQEVGKTMRGLFNKIPIIGGIWAAKEVGETATRNRDPVVVEQPAPLIVRPEVVNPEVIQVPSE